MKNKILTLSLAVLISSFCVKAQAQEICIQLAPFCLENGEITLDPSDTVGNSDLVGPCWDSSRVLCLKEVNKRLLKRVGDCEVAVNDPSLISSDLNQCISQLTKAKKQIKKLKSKK